MKTTLRIALLSLAGLLVSCGGGGGGNSSSGGGTTPAPTVQLSASPTSVGTGGATALTWSSTGATTCTASGGWSGSKATSGIENTAALNADTTFTLSCSNAGGTTQANVTVSISSTLAPTVQLSASPTNFDSNGGNTTLTWTSANATTCTATGAGFGGAKATTGSESVNVTTTTVFGVSCSGTGGITQSLVTVTVAATPAPTAQLSASPTNLGSTGGFTTLTWTSTSAVTCTGSGSGFTGGKAATGSQNVNVTTTTTFTLTCSNVTGSANSSVTVTVAASGSTFPLHVDAGKRYLIDAQGRPFLITGDAAWSLIAELSDADAETYLETRRQQGFNAVLVNLIEHQYADDAPNNHYGEAPFSNTSDFSTHNDAYFTRAASVIAKAKAKGILVLLAPAYMGFQGGGEGWYTEMTSAANTANNNAKLFAYGQYVATKFFDYDNILWIQGGDYDPPNKTLARAIANGIKDVDSNGKWLQTFHGGRGTAALEFLNTTTDPWLTVNDIYTSKDTVVSEARGQYSGSTLPFFLIEAGYEVNDVTGAGVRVQAWQAVLSGASGQVMGNFPVWYFGTGWQDALTSEGGATLGKLPAFFTNTGLAWQNLVPDSNGTVMTSTTNSGLNGSVAARMNDGSAVLVFDPVDDVLTIDMTKLSGPNVNARWYSAKTGTFSAISGAPFPNTGSRSFTPPNTNGNVLVLQSQN